MTEWCSCNKLKEAEAALKMACEEIAGRDLSCPFNTYGWSLPECVDDCRDEYAECWRKAFIRKERRES